MKKLHKEISHMKISFNKYCLKQIMQLFNELNNFEIIIKKIALDFKPSSYKNGFLVSGGGLAGVLIGYFLDDVAIAAMGLAFTSPLAIITGVGIIILGIGIFSNIIYQNNKQNSKKIHDYFEEISKNINKLKDKYINLLKEEKDKYLEELNKLKIDKKIIKYLKKSQFIDKMNIIIKSINSFS